MPNITTARKILSKIIPEETLAKLGQEEIVQLSKSIAQKQQGKLNQLREQFGKVIQKEASEVPEALKLSRGRQMLQRGLAAAPITEAIPENKSQLKEQALAALAGAQQGATFGLSDQLAGLIGAGLEAVKRTDIPGIDAPKNEEFWDRMKRKYREYQGSEKNRLEKFEKEYPEAYMAGDIGGGILTPAGAGIGAAKLLRQVPKLSRFGKLTNLLDIARD